MTAVQRIDIDDPDVDMDDSERLYHRGEPFTGEVTEHLGESLVSLDTYADGYKNGPSREWYKDGTLRSEGTVRNGLPVGEFKEWHANGVLAAKQVFAENGMTLLEDNTWDEHGQPTRTWRQGGEGTRR
ncbi:toxin-antitoxin system YwqK family antitoxin [Streptomyces sp. NPDC059861]|uniref:toxin-antitoxin system YwqK family antitoxin n=1 Tax=Streptomyces sp. NPDC059861 TaxID=3346974 RepID=UPI00364E01FB